MKPTIVKNSEVNELPGFGLCENDLCHLN
jgi:hypothetical protein